MTVDAMEAVVGCSAGLGSRSTIPLRAEMYAHNAMMGRRREGATVHPDLATFRSFLLNIGLMPGKGMTVDRINNLDLEYAADKVRWADKHTQNNNKSDTLTFYCSKSGVVYTTSQLAKIQKVTTDAIRKRRREGWSDDEIISRTKLSSPPPLQSATGSGYIPAPDENSPKSKSADKKALWAAALLWQQEVSAHCKNRELTPDWRVLSNASGALSQIGPVVVSEIIQAVASSWELFIDYEALFRVESGLTLRRVQYPAALTLRRLADEGFHGLRLADPREPLELLRNDLSLLNEVRADV